MLAQIKSPGRKERPVAVCTILRSVETTFHVLCSPVLGRGVGQGLGQVQRQTELLGTTRMCCTRHTRTHAGHPCRTRTHAGHPCRTRAHAGHPCRTSPSDQSPDHTVGLVKTCGRARLQGWDVCDGGREIQQRSIRSRCSHEWSSLIC